MYSKRVSILVATKDRRVFIPQLIANINYQQYPNHLIEVIVADDGKDSIKDILPNNYIYLQYEVPVTLGKKRQDLNDKATGEILIVMDDDDYYPPTRISHAVEVFHQHPKLDFAFSPTLYLYYLYQQRIDISGPWYKNWPHATFAFTKKYAETHQYNLTSNFGEEREFTNYYRVPYLILKSELTLLALVHKNNTIPKNDLGKRYTTPYRLEHFIKNNTSLHFYRELGKKTGGPTVLYI